MQNWIIFLGPVIIWLMIAIVVAVWVYKDAESRGENGVLWLIIVLIAGIIGFIIWLIIRRDKPVVS
jgi:TctA family transporter